MARIFSHIPLHFLTNLCVDKWSRIGEWINHFVFTAQLGELDRVMCDNCFCVFYITQ